MILPQKHISISESMFGFGGQLLALITKRLSVDELWELYTFVDVTLHKHDFDNFILALDYLFLIGAIEIDDGGGLNLATH